MASEFKCGVEYYQFDNDLFICVKNKMKKIL